MMRWSGPLGALLLMAPVGASAHAALVGTTPAPQSSVATSPREIVLHFNENVGPVFVRLLDQAGHAVGSPGAVQLEGNDLRLVRGKPLASGSYLVAYRVISADTHPA
jgi:copper transport protein